MALGAILVIAAVIGGFVLLGGGGDDDDGGEQPGQRNSLAEADSGIAVRWPPDWFAVEKQDKLAFRSPDGQVLVSISAPSAASEAAQVRKSVIAATAEKYKNPVVGRGSGRRFGGLTSAGAVISGRGPRGSSKTLVAVAAGETKAYLLEIYSSARASAEALAGAQVILNSLELTK